MRETLMTPAFPEKELATPHSAVETITGSIPTDRQVWTMYVILCRATCRVRVMMLDSFDRQS